MAASRAAREPIRDWVSPRDARLWGCIRPRPLCGAAPRTARTEVSTLHPAGRAAHGRGGDHYVPTHQIYDQAAWLSKARSYGSYVQSRRAGAKSLPVGNLRWPSAQITAWMIRFPVQGMARGVIKHTIEALPRLSIVTPDNLSKERRWRIRWDITNQKASCDRDPGQSPRVHLHAGRAEATDWYDQRSTRRPTLI